MLDKILWPFMMVYRTISKLGSSANKPLGSTNNVTPNKVNNKIINSNFEKDLPNAKVGGAEIKNIRFKYTATGKDGKMVAGTIDAINRVEAESFLISRGLDIKELKEDKLSSKLGTLSGNHGKMSYKDLAFFLTQLSTYIKSGIPLTDSINILERQAKKKKDKTLYQKIAFELNKGVAFSEAVSRQGNVYPRLLINMLKTSELTGNLTDTLDDMANYYSTSDANRKQIISALTYPSIVFIIAAAVLTFIILYVVPQFVSIYDQLGTDLPTITKVIIGISDFAEKNIITIAVAIVAIVVILIVMYKNIRKFRYSVQYLLMHIPVVKKIIIYKEVIMFTKTFSSLIKHDVFITDSIEMLGKVTNNEIYKILIRNAIFNLSTGNGLSPAFQGQWAFPDIAYEMLLTGERTGKLGEMMESVANYYEGEQKNLITQLKGLIEPIMIVSLAFVVGIILLAIIIPMFDIYNSVN